MAERLIPQNLLLKWCEDHRCGSVPIEVIKQLPWVPDNSEVRKIVSETIAELKRQELLCDVEDAVYNEISEKLYQYYSPYENQDEKVSEGLERLKNDKYFPILSMFYRSKYTVEEIAERLDVDTRTVSRNKKRLCLKLYTLLQ